MRQTQDEECGYNELKACAGVVCERPWADLREVTLAWLWAHSEQCPCPGKGLGGSHRHVQLVVLVLAILVKVWFSIF